MMTDAPQGERGMMMLSRMACVPVEGEGKG